MFGPLGNVYVTRCAGFVAVAGTEAGKGGKGGKLMRGKGLMDIGLRVCTTFAAFFGPQDAPTKLAP